MVYLTAPPHGAFYYSCLFITFLSQVMELIIHS